MSGWHTHGTCDDGCKHSCGGGSDEWGNDTWSCKIEDLLTEDDVEKCNAGDCPHFVWSEREIEGYDEMEE